MKVYTSVIEWQEGKNEVIGIFENKMDAMYVASQINSRRKNVKEYYVQEHELQPNSNNVMSLQQLDKIIKSEAEQ